MKEELSAQRLREILSYDPETGALVWRERRSQRVRPGDAAGTVHRSGYRYIKIDGKLYGAHRLAWMLVQGAWPKFQIDHINGDRADNRWANLRDVPAATNMQNQRRAHRNNATTGVLGVSINPKTGRAHARISVDGRVRSLGHHATVEAAQQQYIDAKRRLHVGCTI